MGAAVGVVLIVLYIVVIIVSIIAHWKIFEKAGREGWESIIPYYNAYVLIVHIIKMPPVWFWLLLVPCANIVVALILIFMIPFKLAEKFGKDTGFALGLLFLGIIFYPILAFGDAQYQDRGRRRYSNPYDDDDDDDDYEERPRRKKKRKYDDDDDD